jgi:hypothetical protein
MEMSACGLYACLTRRWLYTRASMHVCMWTEVVTSCGVCFGLLRCACAGARACVHVCWWMGARVGGRAGRGGSARLPQCSREQGIEEVCMEHLRQCLQESNLKRRRALQVRSLGSRYRVLR